MCSICVECVEPGPFSFPDSRHLFSRIDFPPLLRKGGKWILDDLVGSTSNIPSNVPGILADSLVGHAELPSTVQKLPPGETLGRRAADGGSSGLVLLGSNGGPLTGLFCIDVYRFSPIFTDFYRLFRTFLGDFSPSNTYMQSIPEYQQIYQ